MLRRLEGLAATIVAGQSAAFEAWLLKMPDEISPFCDREIAIRVQQEFCNPKPRLGYVSSEKASA